MKKLLIFLILLFWSQSAYALDIQVLRDSDGIFAVRGFRAMALINGIFIEAYIYHIVFAYICLISTIKMARTRSFSDFFIPVVVAMFLLSMFAVPGNEEITIDNVHFHPAQNSSVAVARDQIKSKANEDQTQMDSILSNLTKISEPPTYFITCVNAVDALSVVLTDVISYDFRDTSAMFLAGGENAESELMYQDADILELVSIYNESCYFPALGVLQDGHVSLVHSGGSKVKRSTFSTTGSMTPFTLADKDFFKILKKQSKDQLDDLEVPDSLRVLDCQEMTANLRTNLVEIADGRDPGDPLRVSMDNRKLKSRKTRRNNQGSIPEQISKDTWAREFLSKLYEKPKMLPDSSVDIETNLLSDFLIDISSWFGNVGLGVALRAYVHGVPYVQGMILAFTLAIFPIILLMSILPGGWKNIGEYFKFILYIKSWTIVMALGFFVADYIQANDDGHTSLALNIVYMAIMGSPVIALGMFKAFNTASAMALSGGAAAAGQQIGGKAMSAISSLASSASTLAGGIGKGAMGAMGGASGGGSSSFASSFSGGGSFTQNLGKAMGGSMVSSRQSSKAPSSSTYGGDNAGYKLDY